MSDIKELIFAAVDENAPAMLKDGGVIHPGYNTEVDELRDIVHGGKGYLATLEAKLKEETGIRTLKIGYNRVFGYYIEAVPFRTRCLQILSASRRWPTRSGTSPRI